MTDTDTHTDRRIDSDPASGSDANADGATDPDDAEFDATASTDDTISIANPALSEDAVSRVESVLEDGMLADGPEVRAFESEFATYCDVSHAVATSNGTTALHAALEALGVEEGDAVVTSPFSFVASANAIRLAGATPVFADVDPDTYTLDPDAVADVLAARDDIVGLLPVHLYGLAADMPALSALADDHGVFVLEDACQAHGGTVAGERVGSLGDAACFSFYPTKNMTTGEGGLITTDRDDVAERAASYVNHGREADDSGGYDHRSLGHNYRLTSLAAAIGRAQLERLPEFNEARRDTASYYDRELEGVAGLETPTEPDGYRHVYHQYTVRTPHRDTAQQALSERNVETAIYYETPIHRQPAYETISTAAADLPQAERAAETVLSLPVHPTLSDDDRRRVVDAVRDVFQSL
ncbi:DegT/DnrJ/EryC1/StrS family aminotransferase [Salinadaptatus halalkaliphilus]|uniref:DegT/DnrJ/EryC1/StrS family aminotransferase n=1 Tax=Salinadaptatus halalkaliphilus TaxID=2419781 RepID=A0A4S3TGH9_9EURY|nr:DegT/DnrJ/EryC1/StrS family aminotransferase [Salinadaptatus halalkaliphilus]THE62991.1 DegT/DnrJ/EryC1/StrS family aminotransferase [Salinadaptatus halalkaliphilus]